MDKLIVLCAMIFLHIIADFNLQRDLSMYKQKSWWEENYPQEIYKYDYITAIFIHSFEWTFMIHIPIIVFYMYHSITLDLIHTIGITILFVINVGIHAWIDNEKANRGSISLTIDQMSHLIYIVLTFYIDCSFI